jgi:hypothetical protein
MSLKVPYEGELELLNKCLKNALLVNENYIISLYKNNYTPTNTDSSANIPYEEADFDGYASKTLTRENWHEAILNNTGEAMSIYDLELTWEINSGYQTIYGYYVLGATSGKILWAEKFTTSLILAPEDQLRITPQFSFRSQNGS